MEIDQGKWQEHLKAAEASGGHLSDYARQHDIDVRRLYEARYVLRKASARAMVVEPKASAFVAVKLKPHVPAQMEPAMHRGASDGVLAMQARLSNGVVLSWSHAAGSDQALVSLMSTLAGLPCSR